MAQPLIEFPEAPYYDTDGEVIWIGARLPAMHPRAVVTDGPVPLGLDIRFEELPASCCTPQRLVGNLISRERALRALASIRRIARSFPPQGFGALLTGQTPPFPLELTVLRVKHLARAYADDDPSAVLSASVGLLGVGSGLTPSGDDLVGAAFFGHGYTASHDAHWLRIGDRLVEHSASATHRISTALFRDLIAGESFAPLHAVVEAMAKGDEATLELAVRSLVDIGRSSGWDMLTGLMIGMVGEPS